MMLKKRNVILEDESGVVMIVALFMILVLTLIGLASTSNSTFEIKLSGNKRGATDAFYTADGGAQSVMADLSNFNTSSGYVAVETSKLPVELQSESIDQKYTSPSFSYPAGVSFTDEPQVTIYHTTKNAVPKGSGFSAISFQYGYYIIDSIGEEQIDAGTFKSASQVSEKVVRLMPTAQGRN